jgi:ZIP family zinc transporter
MNVTELNILSILIIFAGTTLGSALVFFFKNHPSQKIYTVALGFASGIMISAAFFGLLNPSIAEAASYGENLKWLPPLGGFLLGGLLLFAIDKIVPHLHKDSDKPEGLDAPNIDKQFKFFLAVTIHNIPEGLVTGFACGLAMVNKDNIAYAYSALTLGIGIAIQNIPEGFAISVPMYSNGMKKWKAFLYGSASGVIEPIMAVAGLFMSSAVNAGMPWLLSFGAGAMIYVTIDELLPETRLKGYEHWGLWSFMLGFCLMMLLETMI